MRAQAKSTVGGEALCLTQCADDEGRHSYVGKALQSLPICEPLCFQPIKTLSVANQHRRGTA